MTSISSLQSTATKVSPGERMQARLQAAVASGSIKSADQTALSAALGDIGTTLKADKASNTAAESTSRISIKDKVANLIDTEVSNGKLTADQATEMKSLFAQAAPALSGPHGHHGGHHHPDNDGDDGRAVALSDTSGTSASSSTATSTAPAAGGAPVTAASNPTEALNKLVDFLKELQNNQGPSGYNASGNATSATNPSLLFKQTI